MGFKVVHTYALSRVDHGDELLKSLDATLVKGVWSTEDEIISNTKGADAVIGAATEYNITVTNVPDYCMDEVSGLAIGFMLALGHKMLQIDTAVRERHINFTGSRPSHVILPDDSEARCCWDGCPDFRCARGSGSPLRLSLLRQ